MKYILYELVGGGRGGGGGGVCMLDIVVGSLQAGRLIVSRVSKELL